MGAGMYTTECANERRSVHDRAERWEWACTRQSAEMGLHTTADEKADHNTAQGSGDAHLQLTYDESAGTRLLDPEHLLATICPAYARHETKSTTPEGCTPAKGLVRTHITCGHHHVKQQRQGWMSHHAVVK